MDEVEERKRYILGGRGERFGREHAGFLRRLRRRSVQGQFAQEPHPPLAEYAGSRLEGRVEDPTDRATFAADRSQSVVEIAFLNVAMPLHEEALVLCEDRLAGRHDPREVWPDVVPDLGPNLMGGPAQRP